MSRQLAAFEADQRRRNEDDRRRAFEHRRHPHAPAVTAPLPGDPAICRWCLGRLVALLPDGPVDYCTRGCAPNDVVPYLGHCADCGRGFTTGKHMALLCYECEQKAAGEMAEVSRIEQATRYVKHDYTGWMGRK
jgi:hypothetical protein